ncbi:MAG: hypothetical protein ACRDE2_05095 [Chitinophagaceae bacterium]
MEKEICNECGRSVAPGSGLFVNRISDFNDFQTRVEMRKPYPAGEYICIECFEELNNGHSDNSSASEVGEQLKQKPEFVFPIQNPYYRNKKFAIALLHFTTGFLLLTGWYEAKAGYYPNWLALAFLIFAIIEIVYTFFAIRLQREFPNLGSAIRLIAAFSFAVYAWMLFHEKENIFGIFISLVAIAFAIIYRIERQWNKPYHIHINEGGVWIPGTFKSKWVSWKSFNHVILRDNLLTLDFNNNHVVQLDLLKSYSIQEADLFNTFCKVQTHLGKGVKENNE